MAKRVTKKQTVRKAAAKRTTGKAAKKSPKRPARKTITKVARKKTAARAAATRTAKARPKPPKPTTFQAAGAAVKGAIAGAVVAVARRMPGANPQMDAITLLETDHIRLRGLLKQGEETTERAVKGRTELLDTLTAELGVHELIEERLLYPALQNYPEARDIVLEGVQEHHVADLVLEELHEVRKDDEQWGAKFKVLKENIEHHIEEEEGEMFRTARGVMTYDELLALGVQMAKMKRDAEAGRLPR
jgi:hypothetical protein